MAHEFWLDDRQWQAIEPHLPRGRRGARRVDDRRVISGIVHVLRTGCRWRDCPLVFGPSTTIYNRFRRWSLQGIWQNLLSVLTKSDEPDVQALDSTIVKAHRCAAGGKGGRTFRPSVARGAAGRPRSMS